MSRVGAAGARFAGRVARAPLWLLVTTAAVLVMAGSVVVVVPSGVSDRAAVTAYLAAAKPLAQGGGQVVEQGMKPGLADIAAAKKPVPLLVESAQGWTRQLRQVRQEWGALRPPPSLAAAHRGFVAALDAYVGVAIVLEEAARTGAADRTPFVALAESQGRRADTLWDGAATLVQQRLRDDGRPAVSWLPNR